LIHKSMLTSSITQSQKFETFDELDVKNKQELRNLLDVEERVLFSGLIPKINKHSASQDRMLIVTNKNLYNVQPDANILTKLTFFLAPQASVKRKIPIDKIWGITISSSHLSDQFVIHTEGDYDYRYDGKDKREKIIRSICHAYYKEAKKDFPLYVRDDQDLSAFQTTDDDFKAGVDKKPKEGKIGINRDILDKGLIWIVENRNSLISQTIMKESGRGDFQRSNTTSTFGQQSQPIPHDMRSRHNSAAPMQPGQMDYSRGQLPNPNAVSQQIPNPNGMSQQMPGPNGMSQMGFPQQQTYSQFGQPQGSQFQGNNSMQQINMNLGGQQSQAKLIQENKNLNQQNVNNSPVYDPVGIRELIKADLAPYNHNVNLNFAGGNNNMSNGIHY